MMGMAGLRLLPIEVRRLVGLTRYSQQAISSAAESLFMLKHCQTTSTEATGSQ